MIIVPGIFGWIRYLWTAQRMKEIYVVFLRVLGSLNKRK